MPVEARCAHAAVAVDADLYLFGGEHNSKLLQELCMVDTSDKQVWLKHTICMSPAAVCCTSVHQGSLLSRVYACDLLPAFVVCSGTCGCNVNTSCNYSGLALCHRWQVAAWMEPIMKGDVPCARKSAAAAATLNTIVLLGGTVMNEEEQPVVVDELVLLQVTGPNSITCTINPAVSGVKPAPRSGATLLEYSPGKLFLYGGVGSDGKLLNDAFILEVEAWSWSRVYYGHADLLGTTGAEEETTHIVGLQTVIP